MHPYLCHYKVNWLSVLPFFQIVWQTSECRILLYFATPPSHFVRHSKVSFCTCNHPIILESKIFFCFQKAFSPLGWQRCKVFEMGNKVARKMVIAVKARLLRPHYLTYQMHQTLFSADDLVMAYMVLLLESHLVENYSKNVHTRHWWLCLRLMETRLLILTQAF